MRMPRQSCFIFSRGLPLLFWLLIIFFFSSLPGSGTQYEPTLAYYLERKGAHVLEYAVLMFLSARFARALFPSRSFKNIFLGAAAFSLFYAASDEFHQLFVPYRQAKVSDVGIDALGILLAGALMLLARIIWKQNKNSN